MEVDQPSRLSRFALVACIFLNISVMGYLQPFVPIYQAACGLTAAQIGLVASLASASMLLIQPLLGRTTDAIDRRRPLMILASLSAGAAYFSYCRIPSRAGASFSDGIHTMPMFLLLTVIGVNGTNFVAIACSVIVGRMVGAPEKAGRAWSAYRVWGSIGYIVVALGSAALLAHGRSGSHLDRSSLATVFAWGSLVFGGVTLACLLVPDLPLPRPLSEAERGAWPRRRLRIEPRQPVDNALGKHEQGGAPEGSSARQTHARDCRMFHVAYFLYSFAMSGMFAYLALYMKWRGESSAWITGTFATGVVFEAIVMAVIGRLTDRYGRRPALAISFLSLPLRILLYIPATGPLWILCVSALHGLNFGIMGATSIVFVNEMAGSSGRGAAQARLAGVAGLAAATAPVTAGLLVQHVGVPGMLSIMAVVSIAGAVVFLTQVKESHPAPRSLVDRCPPFLRPMMRFLTAPP